MIKDCLNSDHLQQTPERFYSTTCSTNRAIRTIAWDWSKNSPAACFALVASTGRENQGIFKCPDKCQKPSWRMQKMFSLKCRS